jgi:spermidine synthase
MRVFQSTLILYKSEGKMNKSNYRFLSLFLLSAASIGFELSIMRSFSVGSWSNFGSMVISIALLGFGLAGTILTFMQKRIRETPNFWLEKVSLAFMPAIALSHVIAQIIPFKPVLIVSEPLQLIWIGVYYIIYAIPFFIAAVFINVTFIVFSSKIHTLYFWNMTGSGLGGIIILICMYFLPADFLSIPLIIISFGAALICHLRYNAKENRFSITQNKIITCIAGLALSLLLVVFFGKINVSEYKGVSQIRHFAESELDYYSYSPTGEMHVYSSSYLHFAPGLSDVTSSNRKDFPVNAYKGLYIDGSGPIGIMKSLTESESAYIDYLPMSAAYELTEEPNVMLVKLGGGISAFTALHHKAEKVTVIEPNPAIVELLRDVPMMVEFNGGLLHNEKVHVEDGEPRAYCKSTDEKFDIVEISLIDSVGLSSGEPYSVGENYTYTVEAITDYMSSLTEDGLLSVTVWNKLRNPRNVPKLLTTIVASLKAQGVENPENRIFAFDLYLQTATVVVKNSDFTEEEIEKLKYFCFKTAFNAYYYPGIEHQKTDFDEILAYYNSLYDNASADENAPAPLSVKPNELYHHLLFRMFENREEELYNKFVFNIRPATDDRPYYTAYLKPEKLGIFMDQLGDVSEEWGYLLMLGTLFQSILFGFVIILIPLIGRWQDLFSGEKGIGGIIVYYACLGLGYMMIEIFLIQRLVYFLADPIFSVSIVITSMLIISALGSLFASRFQDKTKTVRYAVGGIALSIILYIFVLSPVINTFIGLPLIVKSLIAIILIAPAAFFLGMPFPSGLSSLEKDKGRLLPWALGMNGALSVTGSVFAKLSSISFGFTFVLVIAGALYIIAGLVFPANLKRK